MPNLINKTGTFTKSGSRVRVLHASNSPKFGIMLEVERLDTGKKMTITLDGFLAD
jgi:hypothetical protein